MDTILQEKGNLHLYEKMAYHRTGKIEHINDCMDIVFLKNKFNKICQRDNNKIEFIICNECLKYFQESYLYELIRSTKLFDNHI